MEQYLKLVYDTYLNGEQRMDRTGTGTLSVFGRQLKFDLQQGFPAVTTKKLFIKGVWIELLWMLSGERNAKYMLDNNVHIWDEWMKEDGDLGRVYGVQWRRWDAGYKFSGDEDYPSRVFVDQLQNAIDTIKNNPTDRRMLVSAWNPGELDKMALPPCHYAFQLYVRQGKFIDIVVNQRSADVFLGLPFDIASYATLVHMIAHVTGKLPGLMTYNLGDTHIYLDHIEQIKEQLFRRPLQLPELTVNLNGRQISSIDDFVYDDLQLISYNHHSAIKGAVSK